MHSARPPASATEHEPARALYEQLLHAWNERDAGAFAALFADDATMIGFDASQASGAEIEQHLAPIFRDHPTAPYIAKVRATRALGADVGLLHAIAGMVPPGRDELDPAVNAVQSLVVERRGDGWRIALFQTTPAQYHGRPELVASHTAEIERVRAGGRTIA